MGVGKATFIYRFGLGTWAFGGRAYGPMEDSVCLDVARRAYDLGVRFFDTAHIYAAGRSEELLGVALEGRDDAQVCTKIGYEVRDGKAVKCFDPAFLEKSLATSLSRLRRENIDMLLLHNPPSKTLQNGDVFEWLEKKMCGGQISAWGVSVYDCDEDARCAINAGAAAIEARFSLFKRDVIDVVRSHLRAPRFIARSPLDGGLLTGNYTGAERFPVTDQRSAMNPDSIQHLAEMVVLLKPLLDSGIVRSYTELALRFAAFCDGVSLTIPGAKSVEQLEANVAAISMGPLPPDAIRLIDDVRSQAIGFLAGVTG